MFILCLYYVYIMFIFPGGVGVYLPGRQLDCCCAPSCYISSNCLPCYMYISSNCLEKEARIKHVGRRMITFQNKRNFYFQLKNMLWDSKSEAHYVQFSANVKLFRIPLLHFCTFHSPLH